MAVDGPRVARHVVVVAAVAAMQALERVLGRRDVLHDDQLDLVGHLARQGPALAVHRQDVQHHGQPLAHRRRVEPQEHARVQVGQRRAQQRRRHQRAEVLDRQ